jgi:hypothetical protein
MAFDDRIRASVGELSIEAERGELREGRLALVATGAAAFRSLTVTGLELYAFPFTTSRWRSFREHLLSWPGTLDKLGPDALGAGSTTSTVGALWTGTQGEVAAAMLPEAEAAARDAVFGRWLHDLGIALKDEVARVELSTFMVAGKAACLLVESPEPIDFTSEVTITLEHLVATHHGGGLGGLISPSSTWRAMASLLGGPVPPPSGALAGTVLAKAAPGRSPLDVVGQFALAERSAGIASRFGAPPAEAPTPPSIRIADVARHETGIDVEFALEALPAAALSQARVVLVERAGEPGGPGYRIYTGRLEPGRRGARVHAVESDQLTVVRAQDSILGDELLASLGAGGLVAIVSGVVELGGVVVVVGGTTWTYQPVAVRVIQDGSGRRALLIPMSSAAVPVALGAGTYRLTLALDRARWATTAPADDVNRYQDSATISFDL